MSEPEKRRDEQRKEAAQRILKDFGTNGLRLFAECARANAERRYWCGQVDVALFCIDRALAYEQLLDEVTYGTLHTL